MDIKDIQVFTGEKLPEKKTIDTGVIQMQQKSRCIAAMRVPVPRNELQILDEMKKLSESALDDWFYLWPVGNKKRKCGFDMISGGTVGLAEQLFMKWKNSSIEDDIQDLGNAWKITHVFNDFENGVSKSKTTIVKKPGEAPGGWERDRWERAVLNKAFNINMRDLVFITIPRWITAKIVEYAKVAVIKKAEKLFDTKQYMDTFVYLSSEHGLEKDDIVKFLGVDEITRKNFYLVSNLTGQLRRRETTSEKVLEKVQCLEKTEEKKAISTETKEKKSDKKDEKSTGNVDKNALIRQVYALATKDDIVIEAVEEMMKVKTLKSCKIEDLDMLINNWDEIREKFMPEINAHVDQKGNLL